MTTWTSARWSEKDVEALRSLWPEATREEIMAALPGRSWQSFRDKACKLGLRRNRNKAISEGRRGRKRPEEAIRKERLVFDFVRDHINLYGFGPFRSDIVKATGLHHATVNDTVDRLVVRGLLVLGTGRRRVVGISPRLRARMAQRAA